MTTKPVIKLPKSNKSNTTISERTSVYLMDQQQCLVTEDLYFEDSEDRLTNYDLQRLFQPYKLWNINRERGGGYLSFQDSKYADRVYSLFNGYIFPNGTILSFKLSPYDPQNEPQPEGPILEVKDLPQNMDHNNLYDLFRVFGPLSLCKPITEGGSHRGKALVQFFYRYDSDVAISKMNNKTLDGNTIQINVMMFNTPSRYPISLVQSVSTPTSATPIVAENNFVDLMNLYVKNLDPTVDNTDLFNLFRKFGRIVSARVMSNPINGLSKGYGFVSFSKPEEAQLALEEMNGYYFRTKPMIVAYHEPKKPRQEKSTSTTTSSFHSPPPIDYTTTPYFETRHPHEVGPIMNGLGMDDVDTMSMSMKDLTVGNNNNNHTTPTINTPRKFSTTAVVENAFTTTTTTTPPATIRTSPQFMSRPSLASLASGASIQIAPPNVYETIPEEPVKKINRRSSIESMNSVMTESTAKIQRHRMTEAVKKCIGNKGKVNDIVDMLLTLKKKERSICLFNPDFLKDKINAALEALEICEDEEEEIVVIEKQKEKIELKHRAYIPPTIINKNIISPPSPPTDKNDVVIPPRQSKAIPIVAPPAPKKNEIKDMLASFEGKAIHEKKQLLGDQLFPLVKATGIKQAPKITIRLLDTIALEELANIMFDKDLLKIQVDKVFAGL